MNTKLLRMAVMWMLAAIFACAGCDAQAEEKQAIKQVMRDLHAAYQGNRGHDASELVTPASLEYYGGLLKVAVDGKKKDVQARPVFDRFEILFIRQKSSRKSLKGLDGRGYQTFTTDQGWWSDSDYDEWTDNMSSIKIDKDGTKAWAQIIEVFKPTIYKLEFEKINGKWKLNELSARAYLSHLYEVQAKELGMPINEFLVYLIEEQLGEDIKPNIWDPMPK